MDSYRLQMPPCVYAGSGAWPGLMAELRDAKRVVVMTDKGIRAAGLLEKPLALLRQNGIEAVVLDELAAEPTAQQAAEAIRQMRQARPDCLLAVGGGSVMDVAKLGSVLDTDEYTLFDLLENPAKARKQLRTAMIPTTAGTGAEATPNAIVTVSEKQLKVGIVNAQMIADAVLLDAEMIRGLPRPIAAATGVDALAHAIECYTSQKATPLSDHFALRALQLIERSIERACEEDICDMQAKADMLLASFYAGVAITASGTTAVHALSYPLGGKYHIPHGVSNAMLLMPVMRFNEPACRERFAAVYDAVRPQGGLLSTEEKSGWVLERMQEMVRNVGITSTLRDYGIEPAELNALVEAGMQVTRLLVNNRRDMIAEAAYEIYKEAL